MSLMRWFCMVVALGSTSVAFAQNATKIRQPFGLYIVVPSEFFGGSSLYSSYGMGVSTNSSSTAFGFSAVYDVYRTPARNNPLLLSIYYDSLSTFSSSDVSYDSYSSSTSEDLSAEGYGLSLRAYFGSKQYDKKEARTQGSYIGGSYGLYNVEATNITDGVTNFKSVNKYALKLSLGFEGSGSYDFSISKVFFGDLGVNVNNSPLFINIGYRF